MKLLETDLEKKTGMHIIIDYFSATFPFICYEDDSEYSIINEIILMCCEFFNINKKDVEECDFRVNRFQNQYQLSDYIILKLLGPELKSGHKSCSIELKGQGCREFEELTIDKTWIDLLEFFVVKFNASPTRIDIAIDDYSGEFITFDEVRQKLDSKCFTTSFRDKDYVIHGSATKGFTLEFGSNSSVQMLSIYEKNKEQRTKGKDCFQDYWVRYEMRYRHDKAYDVCMKLLNGGNELFKDCIYGLLYKMLDIKADNNYGEDNIHKAKTDDKWQTFLGNVNKAKIEKYKIKKSTHETYLLWITPLASFYLLDLLVFHNKNINHLNILIYQRIIKTIEDIDERKLKKLNGFLKEKGFNQLTYSELYELKEKLKKQIAVLEFPF
mgnify:CR=1 FL=1